MAIQNNIGIYLRLTGDSVSTSFSFDLLASPFWFQPSPSIENWFADSKKSANPVGVILYTGATSASLSGTTVTLSFSTAPSGDFTVLLGILFN